MDKATRKALEEAGWKVGTVQEFLGLTEEENRLVELRVALALRVRERRRQLQLTQEQFAKRIGSSQSRVAKLESGSPEISLDLMFRGFFAVGGTLADLARPLSRRRARASGRAKAAAE